MRIYLEGNQLPVEQYSHKIVSQLHTELFLFGTKVLVTNVPTGKSVQVVINDRGPFVKDRIIDLTRRAADSLQYLTSGIADVKIQANVSEEFLINAEK